MLPFIAIVMLAVLPFVLLAVVVGINGLPSLEYEKAANLRALSILYETGEAPERVTVVGRDITVRTDELDVFPTHQDMEEDKQWRKAMIEQAMINTCIMLLVKCGTKDVNLLWAFMPNRNGPVSEIHAGQTSSDLDCGAATDTGYGKYGRYLFGKAIPEQTLSVAGHGTVMNYHYSKPVTGVGCSFYDLVDLR